jgi:heterodisulfide reductase subunit A
MDKNVIIVGGGIAGLMTASTLESMGVATTVIEREAAIGGKLNKWDRLFPTFTPAHEVLDRVIDQYKSSGSKLIKSTEVKHIDASGKGVTLNDGQHMTADAIVIASGFELFDATIKEEYGYGIYDNVITSVDLEKMFKENRVLTKQGEAPKRVAILHCVGSRDEKVNQNHCSRVCCVTGVKQAIEIKQLYPDCEVYNLYMDMRMFGPGYEELYRESQQKYGINHIRGRISEAAQTIDGKVKIKAEDTLVGRPLRMTVDMLVLMVGFCAGRSNSSFSADCGLDLRLSNFMKPQNPFDCSNVTACEGVFLVGTVKAPKNISETLHDAASCAHSVLNYLKTL